MYLGHVKVLLVMFLSLKTLYRKRTVIWPFYFYTIIRTLSLSYYLTNTLLHYYTILVSHYHTTLLIHYYTILVSHYHTTLLIYYYTMLVSHYHTTLLI